jgi:hypothetical protein
MKKLFFITAILLSGTLSLVAQKAAQPSWRYASLTQGGIARGSSTTSYTVQTIHGMQKAGLFTGVGVGFDDYGMPGFPLAAHVQKAFTNGSSKPFVYGQAGAVIPIKKGEWNEKIWFAQDKDQYDLKTGFLGEIGGGYLFGIGKAKKHAISLSAGYSFKRASGTYSQLAWPIYLSSSPPAGYNKYNVEEHRFNYHRIVAKIGFMF